MLILLILLLLLILFLVYFLIELNQTKTVDVKPNTYIVKPKRRHLIGGCSGTRFGCCPDGYTAKNNHRGSNCDTRRHLIGGCSGTRYGCCPDGYTAKNNHRGSNC